MPKSNAKKLIKESTKALRELMKNGLNEIAANLINDIMKNYRNAIPSQQVNSTKGVDVRGLNKYKADIKEALAIIARESIDDAKKEIPGGKKIKFSGKENSMQFGELDNLPPEVLKRVLAQSNLLVGKQLDDLKNKIFFQFSSSQSSTDSESTIENDLIEEATDFVEGVSVAAGAQVTSATIVNEARSAFFFQDDVLEEIEAFQFVNDSPVTAICTSLNGTIFSKNDPDIARYQPPLHFNAVLENSMIVTNVGIMPIKYLRKGTCVRTHTGEYREIIQVMSKFEDKEYFEMELENGKTLSLTGEHPVLTKNRGWVRCDELNLVDDIICSEDI